MNHLTRFFLLLLATRSADALAIRGYDAGVHDRFSSGFPTAPVMNPTFIHDATRFTGVGWWFVPGAPTASDIQFTLVSPRHVLSVRHMAGNFTGGTGLVRFVGSDGSVHTRTVLPFTNIEDGGLVDLAITSLSSPLPATVEPLRYRNNQTEGQLNGDPVMVLGKFGRGAAGTIAGFDTVSYAPFSDTTRMFYFNYTVAAGLPDDCYFGIGVGDSSSPVFVEYGGKPALVGINAVVDLGNPLIYQSYCTAVRSYITQLDAVLNPQGYRMRPAQYTATSLSFASAASPLSLRQAHPGSLSFTLANTGGAIAGSASLTLTFAPGESPDSISAPGWVVEALGGDVWSIRKATLNAGGSVVAVADWASLPVTPSLTVAVMAESDTAPSISTSPAFSLAPSYAAWAQGLSEGGQGDDPDDDGVANLLEYAFGGDPQSGAMSIANGAPLLPELTVSGGVVTLSFPERTDAVLRGLSYVVESSTTLDAPPWSATLPAGNASSTQAYIPDVPGFVKRSVTWPSDGPRRFARVKVELAE